MKKIVVVLLIAGMLTSLMSCEEKVPIVGNSLDDEWQGSISLDDLSLLEYAYIRPVYMFIWDYSWDDVTEIKADDLYLTCCLANYLRLSKDFEGVYNQLSAPADVVEWSIQQHFDVESDYMRTSEYYNPDDHTYRLVGGFGGGSKAVPASAELKGKQIIIEVAILSPEDGSELLPGQTRTPDGILSPKGILTIEQVYGKQVKYVSFEVYEQG